MSTATIANSLSHGPVQPLLPGLDLAGLGEGSSSFTRRKRRRVKRGSRLVQLCLPLLEEPLERVREESRAERLEVIGKALQRAVGRFISQHPRHRGWDVVKAELESLLWVRLSGWKEGWEDADLVRLKKYVNSTLGRLIHEPALISACTYSPVKRVRVGGRREYVSGVEANFSDLARDGEGGETLAPVLAEMGAIGIDPESLLLAQEALGGSLGLGF